MFFALKMTVYLLFLFLFLLTLNDSAHSSGIFLPVISGVFSIALLYTLKITFKWVGIAAFVLGLLSSVFYWNSLEQKLVDYRLQQDRMFLRERVSMQMLNDGELTLAPVTSEVQASGSAEMRFALRNVELQIDAKTGGLLRNETARKAWIQSYLKEFHESPGIRLALKRTLKQPYFLVGFILYLLLSLVLTKISPLGKKA
jgi:hypothetical protein